MKYVYPNRIVAFENVENAESLLTKKTLQIGLNEPNVAVCKGKGFVILDFGKELSGGGRILTHYARGGNKVRLRFGESVSETCAELGEKGACNDHSNRDLYVDLQNYSDMTFGQSGFRFLRIDFLGEGAVFGVKTVAAAVDTDEREQLGSFSCDDALVNEIFDTAAYTLRLCLQNGYFWDGIKRDRLVWIGDLYPEMRTANCLFGGAAETEASLDFAMTEAPLPSWMNGIPPYSLWWLIILSEEYERSGDKEKLAKYLSYAKALIAQIDPHVAENGETQYSFNFIDWPSNYVEGDPDDKREDGISGVYYLTKVALEKAITYFKAYGEDVSLCENILARMQKATMHVNRYKQIAGIGVWAGDLSENNKEVMLRGGAKGLSTFLSYFILTGVAAYGEYDAALAMMKEYYGGMLSVGATSFWEDFDIEWLENCTRIDELPDPSKVDIHGDQGAFCYKGFRHSFCHGWSSGVVAYLIETVAGIKPVGVGHKQYKIEPNLSGLKQVRAQYPTPCGILTVEHILQEDGTVKTELSVPDGIEVIS